MSSEWPTVRLGDYVDSSLGKMLDAKKNKGTPQPYLGNSNVRWGEFDLTDLAKMRFESDEEERYGLCPGDLVVCEGGEPGRCAIWNGPPGMKFQKALHRIRPKPPLDIHYLFNWFRHAARTGQLDAHFTGTTIKHLTGKAVAELRVQLPPLSEQKAVVDVLKPLDDRITLLRETNTTLETIAQALFKSWFVDFDPVRARQQGLTPEGMDEATAALFPDGFEESELGRVPKGWEPIRLDSMLELAYGKALKSDARKLGDVPVYGSGGITGWHDAPLVNTPSVVVGRKGTVGSLYWESRPFFPIDTVFYVKTSKPLSYIYYLLQTLGLSEMNTDAAVPGLNRENVYRLKVPGAASKIVTAFDDVVRHLRATIDHNTFKAQTLATLRDTLLPRLIAGQLRLPEAEGILEEIA